MRTLIIEDEQAAVRNLKKILAHNAPELEIIGVLEGIADTIEWFGRNPMPDLVFLDIHLSDGSSFEIFDHIKITCPIIFTTAYDEYALKAFKVNSIDYLLKPIRPQDVMNALGKLKMLSELGKNTGGVNETDIQRLMMTLRNQGNFRTHFLIPAHGDKLIPLDIGTVLYFYISDGVVYAVTDGQEKVAIPHTLDEIYANINPMHFYRISRQYVIARKAIKDLTVWFTGRLVVNLIVSTEEKVIVSRQKVSDFKEWFAGSIC